MKKISVVLVVGSILGFVGSHAFAADVENPDSHCTHALQLIDNEAKTILGWFEASFDSENGKCITICEQKYPTDDGAYNECLSDCQGRSFASMRTKIDHYQENWLNAQKEGCDLAPYEADYNEIIGTSS